MTPRGETGNDFGVRPTAEGSAQHALTWDEIVEHCSRLYTTRSRPAHLGPDAPLREDARVLEVLVNGCPARIVPTRMHEPGFYWWLEDEGLPRRGDGDMRYLLALVEAGEVYPARKAEHESAAEPPKPKAEDPPHG